ncbi:MAG: hypothetical protein AB1898_28070 [Acidobacteriota bacterium]
MRELRLSTVGRALAAVFLLSLVALVNQTAAQIQGPLLGYATDPSRNMLRPIWGVPGASTLGEPLVFDQPLAQVVVSPNLDYVLAIKNNSPSLVMARLTNPDRDELRTIAAVPPETRILDVSPSGQTAVLYSRRQQLLLIVTGLGSAPKVAAPISLASVAPSRLAAAVGDEGSSVLLAVSDGQASNLYLSTEGRDPQPLGISGDITSLRFVGARSALFADRQRKEVLFIADLEKAGSPVALAGPPQGIDDPVALQVSRDNQRIIVANGRSGNVVVLGMEGAVHSMTPCDCTPTRLERMDGNSVFQLTDLSDQPLLLLDAGVSETRVVFVPSDRLQRRSLPAAVQSPRRGIPGRSNDQ